MDKAADKSKDRLKAFLSAQVTALFGGILDYCEVAVGDKERMKVLRSKILKLSNDSIRKVNKELDDRYAVTYDAPTDDIIMIKNKK